MASTSQKPKKGILKHSGSIDHSKKEIEWDEMNILATYHPPDKDYGFMKVDEPPTPYNRAAISDNEEEASLERKGSVSSVGELDPSQLAEKLESGGETSGERHFYEEDDEDDDSEHENETEEERKRRKAFLLKRKMHYNEFQAVQLAKKLMAEEDDDEEEDEDGNKAQKIKVVTDSNVDGGSAPDSVQKGSGATGATQGNDNATSQ